MHKTIIHAAFAAMLATSLCACDKIKDQLDDDDDNRDNIENNYPGDTFEDTPEAYVLTPETQPSSCLPGMGSERSPYIIRNAMELRYFINAVNSGELAAVEENITQGAVVQLAHDIEISSDYNWEPIGTMAHPFAANIDGKNHTISGTITIEPQMEPANPQAHITFSNTCKAGLFGYTENAYISNLNLTADINVTKTNRAMYVGAIVPVASETWITNTTYSGIINLPANTTMYTQLFIGGIGGYISGGYLNNATMSGAITFGKSSSSMLRKFDAAYAYLGGLVGFEDGCAMSNCTNEADITINRACAFELRAGGIAGIRYRGDDQFPIYNQFYNMQNKGDITISNIAVMRTDNQEPTIYAGGLYGHGGQTQDGGGSENSGDISVTLTDVTSYVGGIGGLGYRSNFTNTTNSGNVTNKAKAGCTGGCFGYLLGEATGLVNNGDVTSTITKGNNDYSALLGPVGGIAGYANDGGVHHCINNGTISSPKPFTIAYGEDNVQFSYAGAIAGLGREIYTCNLNNGTVNGNGGNDPMIYLGYIWLAGRDCPYINWRDRLIECPGH